MKLDPANAKFLEAALASSGEGVARGAWLLLGEADGRLAAQIAKTAPLSVSLLSVPRDAEAVLEHERTFAEANTPQNMISREVFNRATVDKLFTAACFVGVTVVSDVSVLLSDLVALELEQQIARIVSLARTTVIRFPVAELVTRLQAWNGSPTALVRAAVERAGLEGVMTDHGNGNRINMLLIRAPSHRCACLKEWSP